MTAPGVPPDGAPGPYGPGDSEVPSRPAPRGRSAGRTVGVGLALALLVFVTVLLVLFVVFNGQTVQISLVFADVEAPLVLALVIAAALGALVSSLAGLVLRSRRQRSGY